MAVAQSTQKRYAPRSDKLKPSKRVRLSTPAASSASRETSPTPQDGQPCSTVLLPVKIVDSVDLPVLSERQPLGLQSEEYQTIADSVVLQASLERSRARWTHDGVFERYWKKPETGRNAKPPPSGNPDVKTMKAKGPCRVRIEPHIFEAEMYVDEKNKPKAQPASFAATHPYVPPQPMLGTAYRPNKPLQNLPQQRNQPVQNRGQPAIGQSVSAAHTQMPGQRTFVATTSQHPQQFARPTVSKPSATPATTHSKASPDPVISMLAERASADQSLKLLMKQVATGNASQEQLRIFQRHIDELTKIIQDREKRNSEIKSQQASLPQLDGTSDLPSQPSAPIVAQHPLPSPARSYTDPQQWPNQSPVLPVVLQFTSAGASEDRFLFPQHSILESLSKQHTLVSFIVVRKCGHLSTSLKASPDTEFWQPVTMMVEVAYGREELLNHIRRWVKPADEVRRHMQEIMQRAQRAPDMHLALRLPFKVESVHQAAGQHFLPSVDEKRDRHVDHAGLGLTGSGTFKKGPDFTKDDPPRSSTKTIEDHSDSSREVRTAGTRQSSGARKSARIREVSN